MTAVRERYRFFGFGDAMLIEVFQIQYHCRMEKLTGYRLIPERV